MSAHGLLLQAQRMIRDQDLGGWTDGHDLVVLDAIDQVLGEPPRDALPLAATTSIDALKAQIRSAGGAVHSDGNVFFTSLEQFAAAAGKAPSRLIAGYEVLSPPGAAIKVTRVNLTEEGREALRARGLPALEPEIEDDREEAPARRSLSEERVGAIVDGLPGGLQGYLRTWGWLQFARALEKAHGIGRSSGDALEAFDIDPIDAYYAGRLSMRDQAAAVLQSEANALATTAARYPNFADSLGRNVQCLVGLEPKIRGIDP